MGSRGRGWCRTGGGQITAARSAQQLRQMVRQHPRASANAEGEHGALFLNMELSNHEIRRTHGAEGCRRTHRFRDRGPSKPAACGYGLDVTASTREAPPRPRERLVAAARTPRHRRNPQPGPIWLPTSRTVRTGEATRGRDGTASSRSNWIGVRAMEAPAGYTSRGSGSIIKSPRRRCRALSAGLAGARRRRSRVRIRVTSTCDENCLVG